MKFLFGLFYVGISILLTNSCIAQRLSVRAFWDGGTLDVKKGDVNKAPISTRVAVQITNLGPEAASVISMPNRLVYIAQNGTLKSTVLLYNIDFEIGINSIRSVPAASELRIVELRAGETTQFWCDVRLSSWTKVDDVRFRYRIADTLASRFGISFVEAECVVERQQPRAESEPHKPAKAR